MSTQPKSEWFLQHLRRAIGALYDPKVLRASPLIELFDLAARSSPDVALRRLIHDAIESLKPGASTPSGTRTWRLYHVLRRRYIEQLKQQEVASDLGLSVRQLQREEKLAREILADHLWNHYDLKTRVAKMEAKPLPEAASTTHDLAMPSRDEELAQLRESVQVMEASVHHLIREVMVILEPLSDSLSVTLTYDPAMDLPPLHLKTPLLRQALLNVISAALRCAQNGEVSVETIMDGNQIRIRVTATGDDAQCALLDQDRHEGLIMAEELIDLCRGTMTIATPTSEILSKQGITLVKTVVVTLSLPAAERTSVLVIDDNEDVLHLFQRYMSGTHYRYAGTTIDQEGFALAQSTHPDLIILDVMMPGRDGWAILSQLRENPTTQDIPVIVCTILSQKDLAMALGAADYIRKPVNRSEFLDVLDRQRALLPTISD